MSESDGFHDEQLEVARDELDRLVRRLRGLSVGAWRLREQPVVAALQELARIDGVAEQRAIPAIPSLDTYALADAVAVVGGDAIAALAARPDASVLSDVIAELRTALEAAR